MSKSTATTAIDALLRDETERGQNAAMDAIAALGHAHHKHVAELCLAFAERAVEIGGWDSEPYRPRYEAAIAALRSQFSGATDTAGARAAISRLPHDNFDAPPVAHAIYGAHHAIAWVPGMRDHLSPTHWLRGVAKNLSLAVARHGLDGLGYVDVAAERAWRFAYLRQWCALYLG